MRPSRFNRVSIPSTLLWTKALVQQILLKRRRRALDRDKRKSKSKEGLLSVKLWTPSLWGNRDWRSLTLITRMIWDLILIRNPPLLTVQVQWFKLWLVLRCSFQHFYFKTLIIGIICNLNLELTNNCLIRVIQTSCLMMPINSQLQMQSRTKLLLQLYRSPSLSLSLVKVTC